MRSSKHGPKALVLALLATALGTMAFAAVAQGQTHTELLHSHALHEATLNPKALSPPGTLGLFLFNGGSTAVLLATAEAVQISNPGVLLVEGRSLEIRCTALVLNEGKINSATEGLGKATFTGCLAFDHKTLTQLKNCELKSLGTIVAEARVLPITHEGEEFILFEPEPALKEGETPRFTTITFKAGTECPLPLENPVTGSVVALVDPETAEKLPRRLILFSSGVQLLIGDVLRFGGFPSYIRSHAEVFLTGAHAGTKLGIH